MTEPKPNDRAAEPTEAEPEGAAAAVARAGPGAEDLTSTADRGPDAPELETDEGLDTLHDGDVAEAEAEAEILGQDDDFDGAADVDSLAVGEAEELGTEEGSGRSDRAPRSSVLPGRRGRTAPVAARAPTPSELAVHIDDRISAAFVVLVAAVFLAILAWGLLAGRHGALSPARTPAPSPSVSVSASPSASASGSPSTSASTSPSASPAASPSASASG